jgi:hypothetical protein
MKAVVPRKCKFENTMQNQFKITPEREIIRMLLLDNIEKLKGSLKWIILVLAKAKVLKSMIMLNKNWDILTRTVKISNSHPNERKVKRLIYKEKLQSVWPKKE